MTPSQDRSSGALGLDHVLELINYGLISDKNETKEALVNVASGLDKSAPVGIRTPNLLIRSQMLYPLSYGRMANNCVESRNGSLAT